MEKSHLLLLVISVLAKDDSYALENKNKEKALEEKNNINKEDQNNTDQNNNKVNLLLILEILKFKHIIQLRIQTQTRCIQSLNLLIVVKTL